MNREAILLTVILIVMSAVLFFVMGADKRRARRELRRVPEAALFLLALLGGAPGGVLGMRVFRHKTRHLKFIIGFPAIAIAQMGLLAFLILK